mgnify:CR=1 FL=1
MKSVATLTPKSRQRTWPNAVLTWLAVSTECSDVPVYVNVILFFNASNFDFEMFESLSSAFWFYLSAKS